MQKFINIAIIISLVWLLAGCETGHLWSAYSLGFSKRDMYIDNLTNARDSARAIEERLPTSGAPGTSGKSLAALSQDMRDQLALSQRIAKTWIHQWQKKPEKYIVDGDLTAASVRQRNQQLQTDGEALARAVRKLEDLDELARQAQAEQLRQQCQQWLMSTNALLQDFSVSYSGYPIDRLATPEPSGPPSAG